MFKGTIEKRVMAHVKKIIKDAETEFEDHIKGLEAQHEADMLALDDKLESDKKAKEEQVVAQILSKVL